MAVRAENGAGSGTKEPQWGGASGANPGNTPPASGGFNLGGGGKTPPGANLNPVNLGLLGPGASGLGGALGPNQPYQSTVYEVSGEWLTSLRANDREGYNTLVSLLRAGNFLGDRAKSPNAVKDALAQAAKEASSRLRAGQQAGTDVIEYLRMKADGSGGGDGSGSGSGRGGGTSRLPSISMMGEPDIAFVANEEAMALVGRELSKQELARIVKDVRQIEQANPTETVVINGRAVTRGGVSAATISDLIKDRAAEIATKGLDAAAPLKGDAARQAESLRQWAKANGVGLSDQALSNYTRRIITGKTTMDDVKSDLRRTYLAGAYPAWADRINAGEDPSDFLSPYVSRARELLEDESIGLNDALVKRMTQYVGSDGKPATLPLYEADRIARKDPRWQYTSNALDLYSRLGQDILNTFGLR